MAAKAAKRPAAKRSPAGRILLWHWSQAEAAERVGRLHALGFAAEARHQVSPGALNEIRAALPAAVVIDLSRLPSHGRDVALALREAKSTRLIPLVFVDGAPEKVARVKQSLPDAAYTTWRAIRPALRAALATPVAAPVVPSHRLAGYSGTPLPKKLGVKPGTTVALDGAPDGFEATLGELPEGARTHRDAKAGRDLTLWFVAKRSELDRGVKPRLRHGDALWILWPKKTGPLASDLGENDVRQAGLAAGLVDFKVCAVDAAWSGLRFTRRK